MTIRSHLLLLAVAAVLPVLAFGLFVSLVLVRYERETQRLGAVDQARAMITAVDAELRGSIATLEALGASSTLARDDIPGFRAAAKRALATQPSWFNITLARPDGRLEVNLSEPADAPAGQAADPASLERVVATLQPQVGNVVVDQARHPPGVPVRVPILRGGRPAYVLTARVRPDSFRDVIVQQHLPADWTSGIVDRDLRFVARTPSVPAGSPASKAFTAAVARAPEGWYRGLTVEGVDTFTAHLTSQFSGWSIGLAIPTRTVEAVARRSAWLMGVGGLLSIGVALVATMMIGRRIARPISSLAIAARSLGSGSDLRMDRPDRVREVSTVAAALQEAALAIRERHGLLLREREALQAADVAKNQFLAMLSHELRNPLAALGAAARVLKLRDPGEPASARARDIIERQTNHMTRLIEDLLDVSRVTMGKASLDPERFDLADAVSQMVDGWRSSPRMGRREIGFHASSVWVRADRARIDQIASNLLDNAVKFTPDDGKISVLVEREGDRARIRVGDQGQGIPEELIGRVFDLFVQGADGIDRAKGGMGIGLALVKGLTEMHGGAVSVESQGRGMGATFTVDLPAVDSKQDETGTEAARGT